MREVYRPRRSHFCLVLGKTYIVFTDSNVKVPVASTTIAVQIAKIKSRVTKHVVVSEKYRQN